MSRISWPQKIMYHLAHHAPAAAWEVARDLGPGISEWTADERLRELAEAWYIEAESETRSPSGRRQDRFVVAKEWLATAKLPPTPTSEKWHISTRRPRADAIVQERKEQQSRLRAGG